MPQASHSQVQESRRDWGALRGGRGVCLRVCLHTCCVQGLWHLLIHFPHEELSSGRRSNLSKFTQSGSKPRSSWVPSLCTTQGHHKEHLGRASRRRWLVMVMEREEQSGFPGRENCTVTGKEGAKSGDG